MVRSRHLRTLRLGLAVAGACVWVAGQAASVVHLAETAHRRCVEHGDLVHAEDAAHDAQADTHAWSAAPAPEAGHHHCGAAALVRTAITPAPAAPAAQPIDVAREPADPPHLGSRGSSLAILRVAPKLSPPGV